MWRSLVARPLWERKVAGSNPVIPTLPRYELRRAAGLLETGESVIEAIRRWTHQRDPGLSSLHRAVKLAVVLTLALAVAQWFGDNPQVEIFASFGTAALLLFAEIPGDQSARLSAYLVLAVVGVVLIVLGTLALSSGWIAVLGMAAVGFTVTFAGVLSAAAAGTTRANLLMFILPVTVPAEFSDIPARLAGWGLAIALAVPVAVFVWPPRDYNAMRASSARACRALAAELSVIMNLRASGSTARVEAATAEANQAVAALSAEFRNAAFRPVGLTTGSRLLASLVDQLDWLKGVIAQGVKAGAHLQWSDMGRRLVGACVEVLEASTATIERTGGAQGDESRHRLRAALDRLEHLRSHAIDLIEFVPAALRDSNYRLPAVGSVVTESPAAALHELVHTTGIVGETVAASAAADGRPLIDRFIGRWNLGVGEGPWTAAYELASRRATIRSVWLRNSIRAALGLALAVWLAQITHVQHSFWIVLGTLSVLRTTAIATGATALRALAGTLIGFLVGAGLVALLGTSPEVLWILLPLTVLMAGFAPSALSFVAGQAAFTVLVVILFNIVDPVGWTVGLVRIEDVAIGCAAGTICGLLLWPAGAAAAMMAALVDSHRSSADALASATRSAADSYAHDRGAAGLALEHARAAGARIDDAIRSYLADRGSKPAPLEEINAAANGARRVRLAAEAIASTETPPDHPVPDLRLDRDHVIAAADSAANWYRTAAAALEGSAPLAPAEVAGAETAILSSVAANPGAFDGGSAEQQARGLWEIALHVDGVTRLQARLERPLAVLSRSSGTIANGSPTPA